MKVALVQPYYFNIWEALGSAYIAAYAKKHYGKPLEFLTFQGYFDSEEKILKEAADCDIVGFSCTSPTFKPGVRIAQKLKAINPRVHTVFGGFHPSAVPNDCLEEEGVDQVVVGEGEQAFLQVLRGNRAEIINGDKFTEFNEFFPDRHAIHNQRTIDLCERQIGKRITSFMSNRVCPLQCTFCAERIVTGRPNKVTNPIRERDPKHLLDEIEMVTKQFGLTYFKFADATWNTSPAKVIAFCEEKIRRGLKIPFEANIHATFTNEAMFEAMKAANCNQINVGCESGSPKILRDVKKGLMVDRLIQVFDWARKHGIERRGYFLIGMPNEKEEDIRMTEALVERIQPEVFGITVICPYPGTDLYDPARMKDWDWTLTDEYSNPYWSTPNFSNQDLKKWQKYLMDKFSDTLAWHNKMLIEGNTIGSECVT